MTRLSKTNIKAKDAHANKLEETYGALQEAIDAYNAKMEEVWEALQEKLDEHNAAIQEAEDWRQEVAREMQDFYDERSEKWQEGEKGQEFQDWKSVWEETLDQVEIEKPEEIAWDGEDVAALLRDNYREEI